MRRQIGMAIEGAYILIVLFGALELVGRDGSVSWTDALVVLAAIALAALLARGAQRAWRAVSDGRR